MSVCMQTNIFTSTYVCTCNIYRYIRMYVCILSVSPSMLLSHRSVNLQLGGIKLKVHSSYFFLRYRLG